MFSSHSSKIFLRGLRGCNKSIAGVMNTGDAQKTATLLNEEDLIALEKDQQIYQDTPNDRPLVDMKTCKPEIDITPPFLQKTLKREFFRNLKELAMTYPLKEAPTLENQFEILSEVLVPLNWRNFTYQKQLAIKQTHAEGELSFLRQKLKYAEAFLTHMHPTSDRRVKLPCPIENILASPEVVNYRNMDEFSVHVGVDGDPKTVGFFVGLHGDPLFRCVPPTLVVTVKDSHKLVAKHFQAFIRASPHSTCLKAGEGGLWRKLIVRSSQKEELLAAATVNSTELSSETKKKLEEDLAQYFFRGPGSECGLTSLWLQACPWRSCPRKMAPYQLIEGQPYLTEECLGLKLRIYPDSILEANTQGAEILYHSIRKLSKSSPLATLLDVCCGSGVLSLLLAPRFRNVIAIDAYPSAIEDAKVNAQENGTQNVDFFCGKIETVFSRIMRDLESTSEVVAVIYPSRKKLHSSVFEAIRECKPIKKLIYVTSELERNTAHSLALLGATLKECHWGIREKRNEAILTGEEQLQDPFVLKYVIPIDLYPQTLHVQYVLLYERTYSWLQD